MVPGNMTASPVLAQKLGISVQGDGVDSTLSFANLPPSEAAWVHITWEDGRLNFALPNLLSQLLQIFYQGPSLSC